MENWLPSADTSCSGSRIPPNKKMSFELEGQNFVVTGAARGIAIPRAAPVTTKFCPSSSKLIFLLGGIRDPLQDVSADGNQFSILVGHFDVSIGAFPFKFNFVDGVLEGHRISKENRF